MVAPAPGSTPMRKPSTEERTECAGQVNAGQLRVGGTTHDHDPGQVVTHGETGDGDGPSLKAFRGIGSGPQHELPDELFERLGLTRDKAEDALDKVLQAEAALRELASQFNHPH